MSLEVFVLSLGNDNWTWHKVQVLSTSVQSAAVTLAFFLCSLPSSHSAVIPAPSPRTCFWYCTWFIDGVGRLHASMDVIGYVAVQKPCARVFCYKFNCLESPREKVIYISSVLLVCLWQGKTSIMRVRLLAEQRHFLEWQDFLDNAASGKLSPHKTTSS